MTRSDLSERETGDTAMEPVDPHPEDEHSDTTVILGRVLPFPVYTVVFMILGVMTITEVLVAELEFLSGVKVPILLALAAVKALLVVWFYMHLRSDSRLFAIVLAIPVIGALVSALFILGTPSGGY